MKTNTTQTPKIRAMAYGLKFDGKLVKCSVHYGTMRNGKKEFTIYARDYGICLPRVEGWENDTDRQTDYFDTDKIRISRQSPFYRAWLPELRRKRNIDRAQFRAQTNKRQAKWAAQRGETFTPKNPFAVWLEKNAHYAALIVAKEAAEGARIAAATYRAMLPLVLTVLPRVAPAPKCAPVAFAWSRVAPTCRPAAWGFVGR